ncbi:MAG: hypothetical protein ACMG57_01650 [Candidatus Dojkabacteria bacterium]
MKEPFNIVYLFHIYQPHWQTVEVLEENYNKFYLPLLQILETHPNYKITLNLTASLTEQLANQNKTEFFDKLKLLVKKGQVELVGSAAYHPVLPLIPEEEVIRQIKLNDEINSKYLGDAWTRKGFFLPELAYSPEVSKTIKDLGFEWLTIDQTSIEEEIDWESTYIDASSGIKLLVNNKIFYSKEERKFSKYQYTVLINDGEGQVNKEANEIDWNMYLKETEPNTQYVYLTASEYLKEVGGKSVELNLVKSNWQQTEDEKKISSYYHLWENDSEPIHKLLWEFLFETMKIVKKNESDVNFEMSRRELDKALASCTWWWVDGRIYGYNPTAIEMGAYAMINAVRSLKHEDKETRIKMEKMYSDLIFEVWKRHWQNYENSSN